MTIIRANFYARSIELQAVPNPASQNGALRKFEKRHGETFNLPTANSNLGSDAETMKFYTDIPTSSNCRSPAFELLAPGCAALSYSGLVMFFIGLRGLAPLGIGSFPSREKN